MNRLSFFLKKLRLENNEVLYDMANRVGVSSSFLSAVENGRKAPPVSWIESISDLYRLTPDQRTDLESIINDSIRQVRLDVGDVAPSRRNCALAFARNFDRFTDDDIQELMSFLEKRRENE